MLATPRKIDGIDLNEAETLARLNRMEALLSAYFGSNTVYRKVFEAVFEAKTGGNYSITSDVFATIQQCDGPIMAADNWVYFEETVEQLEVLSDSDKKSRLRRALEFFHSGKSAVDTAVDEKFFFYWTSLQILCEGKGTMATNRKLQTIYNFSKDEVEEKLLWKDIVSARNDFHHTGKKIHLHKDAERYLQLLFLDLLRNELDLLPVGAALSSIETLDLAVLRQPQD